MQLAAQLVSHFVLQSTVGAIVVHFVSQWSLQHAPHDASQSVELPFVVQLALQPDLQRALQSVEQVVEPGFAVQVVVQSLTQLAVHVSEAVALHCALHDSSSLAAQHVSKLAGAHWVVHSLGVVISLQLALAVTSISPQAEIPAWAIRGATVRAAKLRARIDTGRRMV